MLSGFGITSDKKKGMELLARCNLEEAKSLVENPYNHDPK
jgi:hypothetical protein